MLSALVEQRLRVLVPFTRFYTKFSIGNSYKYVDLNKLLHLLLLKVLKTFSVWEIG